MAKGTAHEGQDGDRALARADEALSRFDLDAAVAHLSAAIRAYTAAGDRCRAAMTCVRLGDLFANALCNPTAGRAWFARAHRLVADLPPCVEQGWVAVAAMGCDVDDPDLLLASAEVALDRARRFGDVNLETKALADAGLAHVQAGRVGEGMALLDEAMALACGPADDRDVAAKSVCSFFTACYYAGDHARAGEWSRALRRHGLISTEPGGPIFLSSHCDSVQASLLIELGRWGEAEAVLTRSQADFTAVMQMPSWHPDIALADLRVRQGRFADAESLLLGKDQAMQALLPAAHLHLARGEHELARVTAERGLRAVGDDVLRGVELLTVIVEAALGCGDIVRAVAASAAIDERVGDVDVPMLTIRVALAQAHLFSVQGATAEAISTLEAAFDRLDAVRLPWLAAQVLLELARLNEHAGDLTRAALDARMARTILSGLDVVVAPGDAEVLDRLAATAPDRAAASAPRDTVRRAELSWSGESWVLSHGGESARLASTKGVRYLADLIAHPGVERHAFDLVDLIEGAPSAGEPDRRQLGHAGPVLDAAARRAYRWRIETLRAEADDALEAGLLEMAEERQAELDQLVRQLAAAFGIGGRARTSASAAERARLNVTRAVRTAVCRVSELLPEAGAALDRSIRTGLYCCYQPADDEQILWIVQSGVNTRPMR